MMKNLKSTTVCAVLKDGKVAIGADGQATMGNTVAKSNVKKIRVLHDGKILAGVSAGAICWFTQGITDSWAHGLRVMDCMSFLDGCCCPHYDGEKNRRPSVMEMINNEQISRCLAIEDGAAVHYNNGELLGALSFYENKNAYFVSKTNNEIVEEKIKATDIS